MLYTGGGKGEATGAGTASTAAEESDVNEEQRAQLLAGVTAFSGLDPEQLSLVAPAFRERRCRPGEAILEEGQKGTMLSVVAEGSVRVFLPAGGVQGERPEEVDLAVLTEGDFFGEYSFIDLRPVSASVAAREPTLLLEVSQAQLHLILDDHCEIARQVYYDLLLTLIDRLRRDDRELDTFSLAWT
jgi:CRP-like cAMP-binding protein